MADILTLEKPSSGILSLEQWQPPMQYPSQVVEAAKAEDNLLLTPEYKAQNEVYNEVIESTPLDVVGFEGLLSDMQANGEDTASAATALADIADKNAEFNRLMQKGAALSYVDVQNAKDPTITANQFRIQYRAGMAAQRLTELAEQFNGGNGDAFLEFLDSWVYSSLQTVDPVEQYGRITGQGSEVTAMSQEWLSAVATMSDDQFDQFVNEKILALNTTTGMFEGGFGDIPEGMSEPAWKVMRELQALEGMGYVQGDVESSQLGAMVDLATADFGSVIAAGRYGVKALSQIGKSAVYRTRNAFGTDAATAAAIKLSPEGVPLNPRVAEDALPTAYAAPERAFSAPSATPVAKAVDGAPPVSQGALQSNWIYEKLLKSNAAGSFGMAGLRDDAPQWATARAQAVASANSTNIADIAIEHDGLVGTTATYTMVKEGGKSFTNFNNAKAMSATIPNSQIVSTKTGDIVTKPIKGDTYAIKWSERRAYDATAMDVSTLPHIGPLEVVPKWFGSNGLMSNPFFNDLIYSADAGGAKFKHEIEEFIVKPFGKLNNEEQGAFSSIITSIQDNGKRNTWLGSAEFVSEYTALTGKAPSEEVIKVYEDAVAASDASWFIQADRALQELAARGHLVVKLGDKGKEIEEIIYPLKPKAVIDGKVMNASTGAMIDPSAVPEGALVYKFKEGKKGRPRFAYNVVGKTRLPQHADALPYKAGGPRSNPHLPYFVGTMDGSWGTLIGTKTPKQALNTVESYNKVHNVFMSLKKEVDLSKPLDGLSAAEIKLLDDVVLANNKWNPNLETWEEFAKFLDGRGISIRDKAIMKERNAKLEVWEDFGEDMVMYKDLGSHVMYSRHDEHLLEYGGHRTYNPNPMQAINAQLNRTIDQAARVQWEQTHVESWAQAVHNAMKEGSDQVLQVDGYSAIFTGAVLARNITIKGNTRLANVLRREQSSIVRRLQALEGSTSESPIRHIRDAASYGSGWLMEAIYDKEWKWMEEWIVPALREVKDNTSGMALGTVFLLKMATPIQLLMQSASVIQTFARRPRSAFQAVFLTAHIREMARHKQGFKLLSALRQNLAKVAGLTDKQMDDLLEHFETSGRGFAKGTIVEDPQALPGLVNKKTKVGKALAIGVDKAVTWAKAPFYEGENISQTVSRITAYLETVRTYPSLDTKSKEFWGQVTRLDRSLNMNLNPGSASMMQKDPTVAVLTQFTSWMFRANETLFFDKALSLGERARFAVSLTVLWGAAGMGASNLIPDDWNENLKEFLKYGPIDSVLKEYAGITIGDRIALNIPSLFARAGLSVSDPIGAAPAVTIGADAASKVYSAFDHAVNGRGTMAAYSLGELVRAFKIIDDPVMAYTMIMDGERNTRSGQSLPANYTTTQAFFQAIGIRPIQVTEFNNLKYSSLARQQDRKFKAIDKATPIFKMAIKSGKEGNFEDAAFYIEQAAAVIDGYGMSPIYRTEAVQAAMSKAGMNLLSSTLLSAIDAGKGVDALNLAESLK